MTSKRRYPIQLTAGEPLPGNYDYTILQPDGQTSGPAEPLGEGGAGVVLRAEYKIGMARALKFLSPADELAGIDTGDFEKTFTREIGVLVELTHTHVAKITDFGTAPLGDHNVHYFAMDYVDGCSLDERWDQANFSGHEFLNLFNQILSAVEYLHARGVMHCDIKSSNILVDTSGPSPSAMLVDLGVAKVVSLADGDVSRKRSREEVAEQLFGSGDRGNATSDLDDNTHFVATRRIVRPMWRDRLQRSIHVDELREMFPSHELYTIGVLLGEALDSGMRTKLVRELGEPTVDAVELVRDRLVTNHPSDDYYESVTALRRDWTKLQPGYLSPLRVPELSIANARSSVSTPNGRVSLTPRIYDLINHPLFQRLHEIPQLELVHLVLPGARHSRFQHSLRVFENARLYVIHLLADIRFRLMVEPSDIEALLLRGLLHDIGHYPLSHMFEDFSHEERVLGKERQIPNDDELFWEFVGQAPDAQGPGFTRYAEIIDQALAELTDDQVPPLRDVLHQSGAYSGDALEAIKGLVYPSTESHAVLAGILTSPVDADKVSYLMDDSLMTGVRYGLGIDFDALLASLRAPAVDDLRDNSGRLVPTIGLRDKGLTAAESVVLARYWMYKRVYWHHTSRAITAMVKHVVAHLMMSRDAFSMEDYLHRTMFRSPIEALQLLSDKFDAVVRETGQEGEVRNPVHGLVGGKRYPYKRLMTLSAAGPDRDIHARLVQRHAGGFEDLANKLRETLVSEFPGCRDVRDGDLIVDVPLKQREAHGGQARVYMRNAGGQSQSLIDDRELSPVLAGLRDEYNAHVKKSRIYVHPSVMKKLEPYADATVEAALREALTTAVGL